MDNYLFTYLAPRQRRACLDEMILPHQEVVVDVNVLSNSPRWKLYCEIKNGKIGGMASTRRSAFVDFPPDHNAMISQLNLKHKLV